MNILSAGPSSSLDLSNTGEDREPGLHLSDVLVRMAWEKDRKYHPDAPKDLMMFEAGHTWETVLGRALAARNRRSGYRPDPFQDDGIWMSPDWVNPDADVQHEEWKATRKSSKNFEQKIEEWGPQVKSYLRALLRRKIAQVPIVRFRVWFMVGDWTFENKGDLTLLKDYWDIDVEYDRRALDENWRGIVSFAQKNGLLQETKPWDDRPSLNRRLLERSRRGKVPQRSRGKATVATFPSTKTSLKPRTAS